MTSSPSGSDKRFRFLHTNDLHGRLDRARTDALRTPRSEANLYFDSGDLIQTGNLGVPLGPDPAWGHLASLDCSASVIGNRETHILALPFRAKLDGARHPILCANMRTSGGQVVLPGTWSTVVNGLRISVVGVIVAMVTKRMKSAAISAYIWDDPIETAIREGERLRSNADVLIALTHIGLPQDKRLVEQTDLYDIVVGGHSHDVLDTPLNHAGTWIVQGGSHGRFYGLYEYDLATKCLTGGLHPWLS
ncbi:MAG: bifunctional metallophosphatase/5'-nucleotidase [Fimbriimonadaceae bacterium]|nr:bifunctional metallophosphatase/5'-nucleotidase [Fimbriimonadaceae bacterium]